MNSALTEILRASRRVLIFTGAGVSVDSGIPDFRSPGGVWSRIDPMTLHRDLAEGDRAQRQRFWQAMIALDDSLGTPRPNPIHDAVVALQRQERVFGVVTQNVDGLHQAAGSSPETVIELHGNMEHCRCLGCGARSTTAQVAARIKAGESPPICPECGGVVRPDLVCFGDPLPQDATRRAFGWARACDLCLVLGSSLVVHPAADIPVDALRAGARLAIVTLGSTPIDRLAHVRIDAPLAESFVPAVAAI